MIGIVVATLIGLYGYVFSQKNFYECYLSSTIFLVWWPVGTGILFFILHRLIKDKKGLACQIFNLNNASPRSIFRREVFVYSTSVMLVGASYLLHSSLDLAEGIHYWDSSRIIAGLLIYSMANLLSYFEKALALVLEE